MSTFSKFFSVYFLFINFRELNELKNIFVFLIIISILHMNNTKLSSPCHTTAKTSFLWYLWLPTPRLIIKMIENRDESTREWLSVNKKYKEKYHQEDSKFTELIQVLTSRMLFSVLLNLLAHFFIWYPSVV